MFISHIPASTSAAILSLLLLLATTPVATFKSGQTPLLQHHNNGSISSEGRFWNVSSNGIYVPDLTLCPRLPPRKAPPKDVHDLRPDDFSVVMAVGDSMTAACFAEGYRLMIPDSFAEWRGRSYAAGMDDGAITVPNLMRHYKSTLRGGSIGKNAVPEVCMGGPMCNPLGWNYKVDRFNAARSGAMAQNLLSEVRDYLVPTLRHHDVTDEEYKYMSFQVGSNDLCQLCLASQAPKGPFPGSADVFEQDVMQAIEYLREHVPNVVVNMMGVFQVSQIYNVTRNHNEYCSNGVPYIPHYSIECSCAVADGPLGAWARSEMDRLQAQYNERLLKIVKRYQKLNDPHFAILWQPANIPLAKFPIEGLSNVDCFHPSTATHERIAAGVWNRLTLDAAGRDVEFGWEQYPNVRCLEEGDRLQTMAVWSE
ncbi:hypothetical protein FRB94_001612 [Tulasnella sp. JGI-2019a]|nr:hypothetical protein FRB94_001612 [Tulasnella sp. JGI-2019a]